MLNEFVILLENLNASNIPYFNNVTTIANITDEEFLSAKLSPTNPFDKKISRSQLKLLRPIKLNYNSRRIKDIEPNRDDLNDLIPPAPDSFYVDFDKLMKNSLCDQLEYDSVSCVSSDDDSYHSCNDDDSMIIEQPITTSGRPGIRLDTQAFAPPPKNLISTLPESNIYTCDKPRCGFTTSNPLNIKLHSCARFGSNFTGTTTTNTTNTTTTTTES